MEQRGGQKCLDSPEFPAVIEEEQQRSGWMAKLCKKTSTRSWFSHKSIVKEKNRCDNCISMRKQERLHAQA